MRVVFLDRDGVINSDRDDYVKNTSELKIYPFVPPSVKRLNAAGWPVFVVSNQQGLANRIIADDDLMAMEREIAGQVEAAGGRITQFYYCRHFESDACSCRKPQPGLLLKAAEEHGIGLAESIMVGDTERDVAAGRAAGCRTILVLTGKLTRSDAEALQCQPDDIADNLSDAVDIILRRRA